MKNTYKTHSREDFNDIYFYLKSKTVFRRNVYFHFYTCLQCIHFNISCLHCASWILHRMKCRYLFLFTLCEQICPMIPSLFHCRKGIFNGVQKSTWNILISHSMDLKNVYLRDFIRLLSEVSFPYCREKCSSVLAFVMYKIIKANSTLSMDYETISILAVKV